MADGPRIYLDHAATTPVLPEARAAVVEGFDRWANPSSPHRAGRAARAALEDARARIAAALGWPGQVILTGGASEAIALAMLQGKAARWLVSAVEHDAVQRIAARRAAGRSVTILPVGDDGRVDPGALVPTLPDTLVAVQAANSETGIIQDLDAIGAGARSAGAAWLCDASQAAGRIALPDADMIVVSAHKLGGPPGIGALLVRDLALLEPAGGQEQGYRPGTENLPAALGFAAALEADRAWLDRAAILRRDLDAAIVAAGGELVGAGTPRLATIGAYRMPGVSAEVQLIRFDMAGIAVSAGSACASGTLKSSPVLAAMGYPADAAGEVVRVSFGPATSAAEIDRFVAIWRDIRDAAMSRGRAAAAGGNG